ncbi:helix-turn-helix transcriptional regulator [Phenylobacterium sp. LjRoot225]|uniref:AraC family transcriptional regulator n=1 Tax=Phenylobacterium sp. LjRoot225 TaxID=3342285 RepID=UPI003ECF8246
MPDAPLKTLVDPSRRPAAGAIVQDDYDLDCPWHSHDMHQLQYAFDGAIEVEDAHARYLLPRSLAAWIPAGVAHRTSLHRVRSGSILFGRDTVPPTGDRVRIVEVSPLMREMVQGAMRWPLTAPQDATGRAYFAALVRLCAEWIVEETPLSLPTAREPRLQAAMAYTRAHLRDGDIGAACRAAGLSERTLGRRFRHEIGMSWEEYRRRSRLLAAAALLDAGEASIGEVAAAVGFESQSSFARAFRGLTGKSPREFRRR